MDRVKLAGGIVAAVLALIVIVKNWDPVTFDFLFFEKELPLAVMLFLTFVLGGASGWLFSWWRSGRN